MTRILAVAATALTLALAAPAPQAAAQDGVFGGALLGGAAGALIGGGLTGRAGGAIIGGVVGAGVGATIGADADRRRYGGGYFWNRGRCWYQYPDGPTVRVSRDHCN